MLMHCELVLCWKYLQQVYTTGNYFVINDFVIMCCNTAGPLFGHAKGNIPFTNTLYVGGL